MKLKKEFAGFYTIIKNKKVEFTIVKNDLNNTWNIYEGDNTVSGWIDTAETLKEAKERLLQ